MDNNTRPVVSGRKGVVSSGHHLATIAGIKMLAKGGNAVDAGVAAGFALTVLKPQENSLGGECPILIQSPVTGQVHAISGQGTAPEKATIGWFSDNGIGLIPGDGYLGAVVPGLFGAYCMALSTYGRLTLADVLEPAIEYAQEGFPLYPSLRRSILKHKERFLKEWPTTAEIFMPGGETPQAGQILIQKDLGHLLKKLVEVEGTSRQNGREAAIQSAVDYFYKEEIADNIISFTRENPVKDATGKFHSALLDKGDFANYKSKIEAPVFADYRGHRIFKCGPWTQGPVLLQQLKLLEQFEIGKMRYNSAEYIHLVVECAKIAYADREKFYGDPDFVQVPLDMLLSSEYAARKVAGLDMNNACKEALWKKNKSDCNAYIGDTTHLDTMDAEGFMMSATPSGGWIPTSPIIRGLGFALGTRAQIFNLEEDHPNALQPGKRPRTTLTPSIAYKAGKPWMAFGTPGGDMQDQWSMQFLLNIVDFKMDLQIAMDLPSFYTSQFPSSFYPRNAIMGTVFMEQGFDNYTLNRLQEMGHEPGLLMYGSNGQVNAVRNNFENGLMEAGASPKGDRQAYAVGW